MTMTMRLLQARLLLGCALDIGYKVGNGLKVSLLEDARVVITARQWLPPLVGGVA
jgi:hypothetical protein